MDWTNRNSVRESLAPLELVLKRMKLIPLLVLLVIVATAANLRVVMHPTRLPHPMYLLSPVYDGNDTIYIIGGAAIMYEEEAFSRDIYRFSISTGKLEASNMMLTRGYILGTSIPLKNGSVLHFGGSPDPFFTDYRRIVRFDQNPDIVTVLDTILPHEVLSFTPQLIEDEGRVVFFINKPYSFDLNNGTFAPESPEAIAQSYSSALIGNTIFLPDVLTGKETKGPRVTGFHTYDVIQKQKDFVPVPFPGKGFPIIAGSDVEGNIWTLDLELGSKYQFGKDICHFNATSGLMTAYEVDGLTNIPVDMASAVYVKKQHKIYIFGGGMHKALGPRLVYSNKILTIDLPHNS